MFDLSPDRWLEREADAHLEREDRLDREARRNDAYVKMLNSPEYQRVMAGLPEIDPAAVRAERPVLSECACCPSTDVRSFSGTLLCKRCCEDVGRVCSECGGIDFTTADEWPTMCDDCRSVESDVSVEWDEGTPQEGER